MLKKIMSMLMLLLVHANVLAQDTELGFSQVIRPGSDQVLQVRLDGLNPQDQFWSTIYLIGRQTSSGREAQAHLVQTNEGVLNKASPAEKSDVVRLIADDLPLRKNYLLKDYDELAEMIEEQTGESIQNPALGEHDQVRVFAKSYDWIPEYNSSKPMVLSIGVPESVDFTIEALYVIVGKGEKPAQLQQLVAGSSVQNGEPPQLSASGKRELGSAIFESRLLILMVIIGAALFSGWRYFRL